MNRLPKLETITEAKLALSADKLSSVTYTAREVHVYTCFGAGTFNRKDWDAEDGPPPSVKTGGAA